MFRITILALLIATPRVFAIPFMIPEEPGDYTFDFSITVASGSELTPGSQIKGHFRANTGLDRVYIMGGEFFFIDPITGKRRVSTLGYADDSASNYDQDGGYMSIIGEHPRHELFLHDLIFRFDTSGGTGFVEGGWMDPFNQGSSPGINLVRYHYDFTGSIDISLQESRHTVPEAGSTVGLLAGALGLLALGRKHFSATA